MKVAHILIIARPKPLLIVLAFAFYPWWFLQLYQLLYTVIERYEMKQFYEERLGIPEVRRYQTAI